MNDNYIKKEKQFSIELLPPDRGKPIDEIFFTIDSLIEAGFTPAYVDITYHPEEIIFEKDAEENITKRLRRKKPGTVMISSQIEGRYQNYGTEAIPHLICTGFTKKETEDALIDLRFGGINKIFATRGDPPNVSYRNSLGKQDTYAPREFKPIEDGNEHASDLIEQIINMNQGIYLEEIDEPEKTNFFIGSTGYPEKHYEAPSLEDDIRFVKLKVDKGASYIITQMFFDNSKYENFVKKCRELGINVPIIPGLKILSSYKQLSLLPSMFYVTIPDELVKEVKKHANDKNAIERIGIEYCIEQCKNLLKFGTPALHFYIKSKDNKLKEVLKQIY